MLLVDAAVLAVRERGLAVSLWEAGDNIAIGPSHLVKHVCALQLYRSRSDVLAINAGDSRRWSSCWSGGSGSSSRERSGYRTDSWGDRSCRSRRSSCRMVKLRVRE